MRGHQVEAGGVGGTHLLTPDARSPTVSQHHSRALCKHMNRHGTARPLLSHRAGAANEGLWWVPELSFAARCPHANTLYI